MRLTSLTQWRVTSSSFSARSLCSAPQSATDFRVCVVGSGPAGFYTTDRLLKAYGHHISVDLLDRLPTPFGLVRSGVAPDHPDTKNVINQFMAVAADHRCNFLGNVTVGKDVSLATLQQLYHAVILAYGAEGNKQLQIPGQKLAGVLSAREFVWWYNGHPEYANLQLDLSRVQSVAICGLGNVAVDCARILLQLPERLASTDIAEHALRQLRNSSVTEVHLIGRRGPVQAAFTPKELREMLSMAGVSLHIAPEVMKVTPVDEAEMKATRMKRRVYDILSKAAQKPVDRKQARQLHLHFLRSPREVKDSGAGHVAGLELETNALQTNSDQTRQMAVGTGQLQSLAAQLVLESIGYKSYPIEGAPFDDRHGIIPNKLGKVIQATDSNDHIPGLYVCGWVKRGPSGIIGTNLWDAQQTVDSVIEDFPLGAVAHLSQKSQTLQSQLNKQTVVDYEGYCKIDKYEVEQGHKHGKPREKITDVGKMLQIAQ
ncbi:hypothetical protein WJX77_010608 [Trebouxia sp. C0004]